jgi:hypothetical protein
VIHSRGRNANGFSVSISLPGIAGLPGVSIFKFGLHAPELDPTNVSSLVFFGAPFAGCPWSELLPRLCDGQCLHTVCAVPQLLHSAGDDLCRRQRSTVRDKTALAQDNSTGDGTPGNDARDH